MKGIARPKRAPGRAALSGAALTGRPSRSGNAARIVAADEASAFLAGIAARQVHAAARAGDHVLGAAGIARLALRRLGRRPLHAAPEEPDPHADQDEEENASQAIARFVFPAESLR